MTAAEWSVDIKSPEKNCTFTQIQTIPAQKLLNMIARFTRKGEIEKLESLLNSLILGRFQMRTQEVELEVFQYLTEAILSRLNNRAYVNDEYHAYQRRIQCMSCPGLTVLLDHITSYCWLTSRSDKHNQDQLHAMTVLYKGLVVLDQRLNQHPKVVIRAMIRLIDAIAPYFAMQGAGKTH